MRFNIGLRAATPTERAPSTCLDENGRHSGSAFDVGYFDPVGRRVLQLEDVGDRRLHLQRGHVFAAPSVGQQTILPGTTDDNFGDILQVMHPYDGFPRDQIIAHPKDNTKWPKH